MSNFQIALEHYGNNKYDKAFAWFEKVIYDDSDIALKLQGLDYLYKINSILKNRPALIKIKFDLATILFNISDWPNAFRLYSEIFSEISQLTVQPTATFSSMGISQGVLLKNLCFSSLRSGNVEDALVFFVKALTYYQNKKNRWQSLALIEEYKKNYQLTQNLLDEYLALLLANGEYARLQVATQFIRNEVVEMFANDSFNTVNKRTTFLQTIRAFAPVIQSSPSWQENSVLFEIVLFDVFFNIYPKDESFRINLNLRKRFVNLLFEFAVLFPENPISPLLMFQYGLLFSKKRIVQNILELFNERRSADKENDKIFNLLKSKRVDLANMRSCDSLYADDIEVDLGEDLFEKSESVEIERQTPTQIIQAIDFLIKSGNTQNIEKLLVELKRLDPENKNIKEIEKNFISQNRSTSSIEKNNQKEHEELLFHEAQDIINSPEDQEYGFSNRAKEQSLISFLELQGIAYIKENAYDLAYAFFGMQMFEVVEFIVDIVESDKHLSKHSVEDFIAFSYLKINALIAQKKFFDAMAEIDSALQGAPLTIDERKSFLYLSAEVFRFLHDTRRALIIYKQVYKIDPSYRMVKNRIGSLENSK